MFTSTLLYAFGAALLLVVSIRPILRFLTPKGIKGFPALPSPRPIVGDLFTMIEGINRHKGVCMFIDELVLRLGPNFQLRIFGTTYLWLCDHTLATTISQDRSGTFDNREPYAPWFRQIIPTGMLVLKHEDPRWKAHRRVMGPAMTNRYLIKTVDKMNESLSELRALWDGKKVLARGRVFDATKDMENAAMDSICALAFGTSWGCNRTALTQIQSGKVANIDEFDEMVFDVRRPDLAIAVWYIFNSFDYNKDPLIRIRHPILRLTPTYRKHRKCLNKEFKRAIDDARRARARSVGSDAQVYEAENTVELMVGKGTSGRDELPENQMMDEMFTYLLAGTETTASAFCWWLKTMTNHPEIQIKLREHVHRAVPHKQFGEFHFDDLTPEKTPLLEAIIYENLRYSREVVAFARIVLKDTVLLGNHVPNGTHIVFPNYLSQEEQPGWHHDREEEKTSRKVGCWERGTAYLFQPERWLREDGSFDPNAGPSLPFGSGIRGCFGKNLALLEQRMFIAQLNMQYFFAPITEAQNSFPTSEGVTRRPTKTLIRPVSWDSPEALAGLGM